MRSVSRPIKLFTCGLLAVVVSLAASSIASSQNNVRPWPQRTITIRDLSGHNSIVGIVVQQWNLAEVGLAFRTTTSDNADITVRFGNSRQCNSQESCAAHASSIGYQGHKETILLMPPLATSFSQGTDYELVRLLSHELGHIMGLKHTNECSIMSTDFLEACGIVTADTPRFCGPDDRSIQILRSMYGGQGPIRRSHGCQSLDAALRGISS